jgi:hypothetical protein
MTFNQNTSLEAQTFHKKLNEYLIESPGRMYIFEITKFCGYSTFIFMYKDETMLDLYNRISHHFSCNDIKGLYIDNHLNTNGTNAVNTNNGGNANNGTSANGGNVCTENNCCTCCADKSKYIQVPISSLKSVRDFVFSNTAIQPRNLEPIYSLPLPVVYRIYLDDGHCHGRT